MRKRTVRRVYQLVDPIAHAKYQASLLTDAEKVTQMTPIQVAVDRLSRGDWNLHECWQPLFECLNRIESLMKLNRVMDADWLKGCQDMFVGCLERKTTAFRAQELAKIREITAIYWDLLGEVTHRQFQLACEHTNANVQRIQHQKKGLKRVAGCVIE